jgi:predicted DCC family thiol-disulfide oxidoreductase YuxK
VNIEEVTVVYDGDCRFCRASVGWVQKKLQVNAIAFQEAPLEKYGLTSEQCSKSVFVLTENQTYLGAGAVAFLLNLRGNTKASMFIKGSGPIGRSGYRWVAAHRKSILVRAMTKILERS